MEWTDADVQRLKELKAANHTWKQIGETLGRNADTVRTKYRLLGIPEPLQEKITACNYPRVELRGCVFDVEVTDFHAGGVRDHFICMSVMPLDKDEITTIKIAFSDNRDDRRCLKEARELLSQYQLIAGHYITGFDLPWLNSRLAYHGMECLSHKFMVFDTYQSAKRSCIKSDRKSLAFLVDFFRIPNEKTAIYPVEWSQIDSPDRKDFEYALVNITEHCESDIRMTRKLFDALWAVDRSATNLPVYRK